MSWKAWMMPSTVPKSPTNGAMTAIVPMMPEIALQRVEMLHQRDRQRVGDVGAALAAALQPETQDLGEHPLVAVADADRAA